MVRSPGCRSWARRPKRGSVPAGSSPSTPVGHPNTFVEWYSALPQAYMAHVMSMVSEGVFEKFPHLNVLLVESTDGFALVKSAFGDGSGSPQTGQIVFEAYPRR